MAKLITAALLISFVVAINGGCPSASIHDYGYTGGCTKAAPTTAAAFAPGDLKVLFQKLKARFGDKIPASITTVQAKAMTADVFKSLPVGKYMLAEKEALPGEKMDWYPLLNMAWPDKLTAASKLECGAWHTCKVIQILCILG